MSDDGAPSGRAAKLVDQLTKAAGDSLGGERVAIAVRVNLKGTVAATAAGAIGGAAGAVVAANTLEPGAAEAAAAGFPTAAQQALGVTDSTLVVTSRSSLSGKPKAHLASIPLAAIASVTHEPGRLGDTLSFTMADGTSTSFECVKVDPGEAFATAVTARLSS